MGKFWKDFKAFISKGNVVDLAIAVIIGAAFNKIVSSLVNDVIMPLVSLAMGGASVADWKWVIKPAVYDGSGVLITAETALRYGVFLQAIIDFLIIALCIFIALRIMTASQRKLAKLSEDIKKKTKKKRKGEPEELVEESTEVVEPAPAPVPTFEEKQEALLTEIRDLLKQNAKETKPKVKAVKNKEVQKVENEKSINK